MFERMSRSVTMPTRTPCSSVTTRCQIWRRAISRQASATDVVGGIVKTCRVMTSRTRMARVLRAGVGGRQSLQLARERQDIVDRRPHAVGVHVDGEIGP